MQDKISSSSSSFSYYRNIYIYTIYIYIYIYRPISFSKIKFLLLIQFICINLSIRIIPNYKNINIIIQLLKKACLRLLNRIHSRTILFKAHVPKLWNVGLILVCWIHNFHIWKTFKPFSTKHFWLYDTLWLNLSLIQIKSISDRPLRYQ